MNGLAGWVKVWLVTTTVICTLDAVYVLGRPATFDWPIFSAYKIYTAIDKSYGPEGLNDGFVKAQSYQNLVENVACVAALLSSCPFTSAVIAYTVSALTAWKTVSFMLFDPLQGFKYTGHASLEDHCFFIVLSVIWIIVPVAVMVSTARSLAKAAKPCPKKTE